MKLMIRTQSGNWCASDVPKVDGLDLDVCLGETETPGRESGCVLCQRFDCVVACCSGPLLGMVR